MTRPVASWGTTNAPLAGPGADRGDEAVTACYEDFVVDCCNEKCAWSGLASDCVTPKHEPDHLLCPECYKVVEPVGEPWP